MPPVPALRHGILALAATLIPSTLQADPVPVRRPSGTAHGFLALRSLDGKTLAIGDLIQTVQGSRITSRLVFHFRDGSVDDDTVTFTQHTVFHLLTDHHIQRGPSFPKPIDVLVDAATGQISSRGEDGTINQDHLDLPPDISNGLTLTLLMNIYPATAETRVSYAAPMSKPRLIHLSIKPAGNVPFTIGGTSRRATRYVIHVELGGVTGVVAPIIGKQPADAQVWILDGSVPAFIREEGQLYQDGPIWRIEQISPAFSH